MRQCPACKKWALDFDEYFGRFRCSDPNCGWMPPSSAEREMRLLSAHKLPKRLGDAQIPEMGLTLTYAYDAENDVLLFDFGLSEPTFDLPEGDGRMIWQIGRGSESVAGFTLVGVRKWGGSEIHVNIDARKQDIENNLRKYSYGVLRARPTKTPPTEVTCQTAMRNDESPICDDSLRKCGLRADMRRLRRPNSSENA